MYFQNLCSWLLLSSTALAAPAPPLDRHQRPLVHDGSPYNKDHYDPYDEKFDSFGEDVQPLPVVSIKLHYHIELDNIFCL